MGLDWISVVRLNQAEREEYVRQNHGNELEQGVSLETLVKAYAPSWGKPCNQVGAPRLRDLPDFEERMQLLLDVRQDQARLELERDSGHRNQHFIEHWQQMTVEKLMERDGAKFVCEECPLLKALNGADSRGSYFLGVTVTCCDFRGKRIGADGALGDLADEAYRDHDPDQMLDYADRLERRLDRLRKSGLLKKDPYPVYVDEFRKDPWAKVTGAAMLTEAEYEKALHWREQNTRDAVHWLRTCAGYGVHMQADY